MFNWNIHSGIRSLDPAFARDQAGIWVTNQLFNGLVTLTDDLTPAPAIAHRWEINDDGTLYTFFLRDDVFFHDHEIFPGGKGRRVTAHDFVYSFNRIIDPATASPGAWIFNDKVEIADNKGSFYALNDSTFQVKLLRPFPPMLGLLTMKYCSVVPQEVVEHYGRDFRSNPVGTGPFMYKYWEEGVRLVLHKNPNYFEVENGQRLPYLDAVNISFITSKQNEFFAFVKGDLDLLSGLDASFKDNLLTRSGDLKTKFHEDFEMQKIPFLNTEYFGILVDSSLEVVQQSPLRYKKVRQAINYGFDRARMLKFLRNNIGRAPAGGFVPMGLPSFDTSAVRGYSYDPDKAAALLAEAGFPQGKGLPEITVHSNPTYLDLALYIQRQLKDLGIRLKIEVNQPAMHRQWMANAQSPFFRASWIADYPDAENYLALFYSRNHAPSGPNYTRYSNAEFDKLYIRSQTITDDDERYKIYHRMENIMLEDAPVVVLYYDELVRLVQNNVKGLNKNPINLIDLSRVQKQ